MGRAVTGRRHRATAPRRALRARPPHRQRPAPHRAGPSTARATTRSAATVARDRVGLLVVSDPALPGAAETAWRTAVDLHDIVLGPADGGRFAPEVEAALETARERCRDAHTALRIAGSAYVHAR
ncbi:MULTISPECIES: hypothetical protein [Streptomyces]|uniref:hypothetical protein n=1 Tax=Streptomyces TaxID=1883 RepID=UPI0016727228|nr:MULTISPECIES: hypothetical protein [Streptomyces]MBK3520177.1 hypothetical protein [Streptomyces sp. MBT70]GGR73963.1 hypothetical protein GCM10010236_30570 [Streptomyces eurythermus]